MNQKIIRTTLVPRKIFKRFFNLLFTLYATVLLLIEAPLIALSVAFAANQLSARRFCRFWCRCYLYLLRLPIQIDNNLGDTIVKTPVIFVSNHASYTDFLVLLATLPAHVLFVAKSDLLSTPVLGWLMRSCGYMGIDRKNYHNRQNDVAKLHEAVRAGLSLVIFPEGTFKKTSGLRAFKPGAFKISRENNARICPISLNGTRRLLTDGSALLQFTRIRVAINTLIHPEGKTIETLESMVRTQILRGCGEPSLEQDI